MWFVLDGAYVFWLKVEAALERRERPPGYAVLGTCLAMSHEIFEM